MAIIIRGVTACPLCGEVLRDGDDIVATPHFLHSGPLSRYSDAAMHRECFTAWPKADAFRSAFNDFGRSWPGGPHQMLTDGTIVKVTPDDLPPRQEEEARLTVGVLGDVEDRVQLLAALDATGKRKA